MSCSSQHQHTQALSSSQGSTWTDTNAHLMENLYGKPN